MSTQEKMIEALGQTILNLLMNQSTIQDLVHGITIKDLGREMMDQGDESDDPLYWATNAIVFQKALLHAGLGMRYFPDKK